MSYTEVHSLRVLQYLLAMQRDAKIVAERGERELESDEDHIPAITGVTVDTSTRKKRSAIDPNGRNLTVDLNQDSIKKLSTSILHLRKPKAPHAVTRGNDLESDEDHIPDDDSANVDPLTPIQRYVFRSRLRKKHLLVRYTKRT
jgi:hypothetical protein